MQKIIARYSLVMTMSPHSDLASFAEGTRLLARRPLVTLGLATLGMGLTALAPLLQIKFHLPNDDVTASALLFAALFPLEMYGIPRFLAEADASFGDRPGNPKEGWEQRFDARWMLAMAGKFLLFIALGLGLLCLIVPGVMVLFAFGWVPMRILLRGESLAEAARGSLQLMLRAWRRVVGVVLLLFGLNLLVMMILSLAAGFTEIHPQPWEQLTHPRFWVVNFLSILLSLWTSACLLALFRRVEVPPAIPSSN